MKLEKQSVYYLLKDVIQHDYSLEHFQPGKSKIAGMNKEQYREFLMHTISNSANEEEKKIFRNNRQEIEEDIAWAIYDGEKRETIKRQDWSLTLELRFMHAKEKSMVQLEDRFADEQAKKEVTNHFWCEDFRATRSRIQNGILMKFATDYAVLPASKRKAVFDEAKDQAFEELQPVQLRVSSRKGFFDCDRTFEALQDNGYLRTNPDGDTMLTNKGVAYVKKLDPTWK